MAWVTFTADYNHDLGDGRVAFYREGRSYNVVKLLHDLVVPNYATKAANPAKTPDDEQVSEGLGRTPTVDGGDSAVDGDTALASAVD
jgi:hypothetical protein